MTYLPDLHTYLHQSSLLIQAYPTSRITTKYSLPRRRSTGDPNSKRTQKKEAIANQQQSAAPSSGTASATTTTQPGKEVRERREPAATLTLKTFHADSGICLKYRTDKAQEVGRLLSGLGRLAKGEIIDMPSTTGTTGGAGAAGQGDKMDVDEVQPSAQGVGTADAVAVAKNGKGGAEVTADGTASKSAPQQQQQQQQQGGGGGGKKKKKGGKK